MGSSHSIDKSKVGFLHVEISLLKNAGQGLLTDDYLCLKIDGWLISNTVPITH